MSTVPGPTSLRWRTLRSAAFAAIATGVAALGHVVGGGMAPDVAVLIAGGAGAWAVVIGLARRRRGPIGILAAMLACQLGFHLLFAVDAHGMTSGTHGMSAGTGGAPDAPLRMLIFHLVAAALSAVVLGHGERALFTLFAALARSIRVPAPPAAVELPPRWIARPSTSDAPRPDGPLLSTSPRRGPPAENRRLLSRCQFRVLATTGRLPCRRRTLCAHPTGNPPVQSEGFPCQSFPRGAPAAVPTDSSPSR